MEQEEVNKNAIEEFNSLLLSMVVEYFIIVHERSLGILCLATLSNMSMIESLDDAIYGFGDCSFSRGRSLIS
ncbi:hypothetical protein Avbf_09214 [Armadillidium vulgare]|nr:hypothetical protein Avbf_09214 [Armadillidium vulgare]